MCYLIGKVHHAQEGLHLETERGEAGHAGLWTGELVQDDGVLGVHLLFFPAVKQNKTISKQNTPSYSQQEVKG